MSASAVQPAKMDWAALWRSGDLGRFCFISMGIMLHATNETMVATVMPALVRDLSGVELVGWSLSVYELGAIAAGAAAGRAISYISLRTAMVCAALTYCLGALICATADTMPIFLVGRVIQGLGGGGLMGLAFVSIERLFPRIIWPQLFAIISAVWGVSAFGGPLIGALFVEHASWPVAFSLFSTLGFAMAVASLIVLRGASLRGADQGTEAPPPFPFATLLCLSLSVLLIAVAGIAGGWLGQSLLLAAGIGGLLLFFRLDERKPRSRLFPSRVFSLDRALGAGMVMVGCLSISTCSFFVYGPLLLTNLHGIPPLTTGYIIAAESIAWSILSIAVAKLPPEREGSVIVGGAMMVAGGVLGFAYAVPAGSIPLILFCALLQGGGFGICWPFVARMIVASAPEHERTVASSGISALQRIGYAAGAALSGIVANAAGFGDGLNKETAAHVAPWLFLAFMPLAALGVFAAFRLVVLARREARQ
ncbi:MAG: MFS transporter [Mesorhizobium amorphae]|nr:MAG: MFS transporter [Mesorhizobium amorphae]